MAENPFEPPTGETYPVPSVAASNLWRILREVLSAFGCLGAAILAVIGAIVLLFVLGLALEVVQFKSD